MLAISLVVSVILVVVIIYLIFPGSYGIDFFVANHRQVLDAGPFLFQQQPLYVYNPSIAYDNDGEIVGVSRLTGKIARECDYRTDRVLVNESINKELEKYPASVHRNHSSVMFWKMDRLPAFEILPVFSPDNLCNETSSREFQYSMGLEDPRLFRYQNRLWIYGHFRGTFQDGICSHSPVIATLDRASDIIRLRTSGMKWMEKNWMPFEWQGDLYFVYEISPHIILRCDVHTGECVRVYQTDNLADRSISTYHIGGGAPAASLYIDGLPYFLTVAHTRIDTPRIIRKNFFYLFRGQPPFDVVWVGPTFDVMEDQRDIEFSAGILLDRHNPDTVLLSSGVSDCYSVISRYSLNDVLKAMVQVAAL